MILWNSTPVEWITSIPCGYREEINADIKKFIWRVLRHSNIKIDSEEYQTLEITIRKQIDEKFKEAVENINKWRGVIKDIKKCKDLQEKIIDPNIMVQIILFESFLNNQLEQFQISWWVPIELMNFAQHKLQELKNMWNQEV